MYREPAPRERDLDLELIEAAFEATKRKFAGGVPFFVVLAAVVVFGGIARGIPWLSVIGGVFFLGLAWLMIAVKKKTERSPAMVALRESPDAVASVKYARTSDSRGLFVTHWLRVKTADGAMVSLRVDGAMMGVAKALARRCPKADIDVPGFRRPAGQ